MTIKLLHSAGAIRRFHNRRVINQDTVGQHSWGVALIILRIVDAPSAELLKAAIYHDIAEVYTGDVPYPVKRDYPSLLNELRLAENNFESSMGLTVELGRFDLHVLKWADMFELLMHVTAEIEMGNSTLRDVRDTAIDALDELGDPNLAAQLLRKQVLRSPNERR